MSWVPDTTSRGSCRLPMRRSSPMATPRPMRRRMAWGVISTTRPCPGARSLLKGPHATTSCRVARPAHHGPNGADTNGAGSTRRGARSITARPPSSPTRRASTRTPRAATQTSSTQTLTACCEGAWCVRGTGRTWAARAAHTTQSKVVAALSTATTAGTAPTPRLCPQRHARAASRSTSLRFRSMRSSRRGHTRSCAPTPRA